MSEEKPILVYPITLPFRYPFPLSRRVAVAFENIAVRGTSELGGDTHISGNLTIAPPEVGGGGGGGNLSLVSLSVSGDTALGNTTVGDPLASVSKELQVTGNLKLNGVKVRSFSVDPLLGSDNETLPTQKAVKTYVDNGLAAKASTSDLSDFNTSLTAVDKKLDDRLAVVETGLAAKASTSDLSDFNTSLTAVDKKLDDRLAVVETGLAAKANTRDLSDFNTSLTAVDKKLDDRLAVVETGLTAKASTSDIADINSSLSAKATLNGDLGEDFRVNNLTLGAQLSFGEKGIRCKHHDKDLLKSVTADQATILLYYYNERSWAGIGILDSGDVWLRVGTGWNVDEQFWQTRIFYFGQMADAVEVFSP
jgi:hypothetical protein